MQPKFTPNKSIDFVKEFKLIAQKNKEQIRHQVNISPKIERLNQRIPGSVWQDPEPLEPV